MKRFRPRSHWFRSDHSQGQAAPSGIPRQAGEHGRPAGVAWKAVPAVKDGRAVVIDGDLSAAYSLGSTMASMYAIKNLVPKLEATLK